VREIGDSGTIGEIVEKVVESEGFTDEQQGVLHGDGPNTEIGYRLAWARTYTARQLRTLGPATAA
jgi:restriction system protein